MPFEIDFKNKLVLITGGARGLGVDVARSFASAGANIAITYNATPGDKLAAELSKEYGVKVLAFKMPASPSSAIDAAVALITATMGEIDVVVANAGICIHESAENMTDAQFEDTFQVNCFSPFYLARAAHASWYPGGFKIENVKKEKVILFVSSISGVIVNIPQLQCAYNASKAALTMLGKSLAGEWSGEGIRVNVLSPGYIATEMSTGATGAKDSDWMSVWKERIPLGRFAQPKEIADMLVMVASNQASYLCGSDVMVDGGYTAY